MLEIHTLGPLHCLYSWFVVPHVLTGVKIRYESVILPAFTMAKHSPPTLILHIFLAS